MCITHPRFFNPAIKIGKRVAQYRLAKTWETSNFTVHQKVSIEDLFPHLFFPHLFFSI